MTHPARMLRPALAVSALLATAASHAIYGVATGTNDIETGYVYEGQLNGGGAVVIDPHWVITVAHLGDADFYLNGWHHADYHSTNNQFDLVLYHFQEAFPDVAPIFNGDPTGMEMTMVGFGWSANPSPDHKGFIRDWDSIGGKRSATNTIGWRGSYNRNHQPFYAMEYDLDGDAQSPDPYNRDWFGDGGPTAREGGILGYDSGGGWYVDDGGTMKLVGLGDYVGNDPNIPAGDLEPILTYGFAGGGGVDLTAEPVQQWMRTTMSVPEPASISLLALGAAALFRKRKQA